CKCWRHRLPPPVSVALRLSQAVPDSQQLLLGWRWLLCWLRSLLCSEPVVPLWPDAEFQSELLVPAHTRLHQNARRRFGFAACILLTGCFPLQSPLRAIAADAVSCYSAQL